MCVCTLTLKSFCIAFIVENSREVIKVGGISSLSPELRNEIFQAIHRSDVYTNSGRRDEGVGKGKYGCCIL